jgi:hypothetical protein
MVCQWFGLKTTGIVSPGLVSKSVATVSPGLCLKIGSYGVVFVPQNHHDGFMV